MSIATQITRLQEAKADIKEAIENKGVAVSSSLTISDYAPLINSIPTGTVKVESKDVNFYDYDGTLVNSYSASEFLALNEMPTNPTHEGLTSQGWNWTLSDAKEYVNEIGVLDIGMYYVTDDNKTRIYIHLTKDILSLYCGIVVNGTVTIDWGDNSQSETITGTSVTDAVFKGHTYSSIGDYVISLSSEDQYRFAGGNNVSYILSITQGNDLQNILYLSAIKKVELASNVDINKSAFNNCCNLNAITITNTTRITDSLAFQDAISLKYITFPTSTVGTVMFSRTSNLQRISLARGAVNTTGITFSNSYKLKRICLPNTITTISSYLLQNCNSLSSIKIPNSVTRITSRPFYQALGLKVCDFTSFTSIPTLTVGDNVFASNQTDLKIIVPDDLYDDWIVATNWSNYSSYMIKESDYVD